jgi:uncharacterized membrane protein
MSSMIDVSALRIAIDGRGSKFVQTELDAILKGYDRSDGEGRARCMREVAIMLRRVRDSWVYGGANNEPSRPQEDARAAYARLFEDARTRLARPRATAAPTTEISTNVILVTILVAARGELFTVSAQATGEDLRKALEAAIHRPASDLVGFDVIWTPSEPGATVSSHELEAAYSTSELHPLQNADAGKAYCTYCRGPLPAELVTCPHCGAPARDARSTR